MKSLTGSKNQGQTEPGVTLSHLQGTKRKYGRYVTL